MYMKVIIYFGTYFKEIWRLYILVKRIFQEYVSPQITIYDISIWYCKLYFIDVHWVWTNFKTFNEWYDMILWYA